MLTKKNNLEYNKANASEKKTKLQSKERVHYFYPTLKE